VKLGCGEPRYRAFRLLRVFEWPGDGQDGLVSGKSPRPGMAVTTIATFRSSAMGLDWAIIGWIDLRSEAATKVQLISLDLIAYAAWTGMQPSS
jgi:hypothetical protein